MYKNLNGISGRFSSQDSSQPFSNESGPCVVSPQGSVGVEGGPAVALADEAPDVLHRSLFKFLLSSAASRLHGDAISG